VLLLTITLTRNRIYHDGLALWTDAVDKYPNAPRPHNALGSALLARARIDDAIVQFKEALRIAPTLSVAHANLGMTYSALKRWPEAADHLRQAVTINPVEFDGKPYLVLGGTLMQLGKNAEAIPHLQEGLRRTPGDADGWPLTREERSAFSSDGVASRVKGWYNLANALAAENKRDEAIDAYREVLKLRPDYLEAAVNMAIAHETAARWSDALTAYDAAMKSLPKKPTRDALFKLHYNRARTLLMLDRKAESAESFRAALRIDPNHEGAKQGLAATQ
jgi:tetratricopeptide (TPR) repeat protein